MKVNKKTSRELRRLVAYFGGTEQATATALGVKQPTVNGWLNGRHGISPLKAMKIEKMTAGNFRAVDLCPKLADFAE